jgi:hypothetical protein
MRKTLRSILRWTGISLLAVLALYAVLVVIGSIAVWREKAALKADGRPMQAEEIMPPKIPDQDNAALVYNAAFKAIKDQPPLKLEGDNPPPDVPPAEVAAPKKETGTIFPSIEVVAQPPDNLFSQLARVAREFNKSSDDPQAARNFEMLLRDPSVSEFLSSVERASDIPGYRQNIDYAAGPSAKMPHISDNLTLAQILSAKAIYNARAGRGADAWQAIEVSMKLVRAVRDEPTLISQMVRMSQLASANGAIRKVADLCPPDAATCEDLSNQIQQVDLQSSLVAAYDQERVLGAEWIFTRLFLGYVLPWDRAASLKTYRELCQDLQKQQYGKAKIDFRDYAKDLPPYCILTRLMVPAVASAGQRLNFSFSDAEITRLGLVAIRYKQEHGAFPPDLRALGGQDILDPFTGQPFIYRPEANGFLLYSNGPDLADDEGAEYDYKTKKGDIAWRYVEKAG